MAETRIGIDDLIAPLFVREDVDSPQPIVSLPGVMQHSQQSLLEEVRQLRELGVSGVMISAPSNARPIPSKGDRVKRRLEPTAYLFASSVTGRSL